MNNVEKSGVFSPRSLWKNPERSIVGDKLLSLRYPWEALSLIGEWIKSIGPELDKQIYLQKDENIWIARNVSVAPTATITGPCIIGPGTEIRPGAFIRGNVIAGEGVVIGNSTELKNCILFDKVQVPHFNYVGDSILGTGSHLGAGAITSNVKSDKTPVVIRSKEEEIPTGIKKVGAFLGDFVEVGCQSVLNPGTVIGPYTNVYPLSCVRGYIPENSILKGEKGVFSKR